MSAVSHDPRSIAGAIQNVDCKDCPAKAGQSCSIYLWATVPEASWVPISRFAHLSRAREYEMFQDIYGPPTQEYDAVRIFSPPADDISDLLG